MSADTYNNRIQKFFNNGTFVTAWGITGNNTGMFNRPAGVATDSKDFVYVADTYNNRIQKFFNNGNL